MGFSDAFHWRAGPFRAASCILSLALLLSGTNSVAAAPTADPAVYDYVVIGSGPGGGPLAANLAKAGYSVFLIEAGDDSPSLGFGSYPPSTTWGFFCSHGEDKRSKEYTHQTWQTPEGRYWVGGSSGAPAGSKLLGVYYPRGSSLGGSSMINAMVTWFPSDSDWNYHYEVTGDETWK